MFLFTILFFSVFLFLFPSSSFFTLFLYTRCVPRLSVAHSIICLLARDYSPSNRSLSADRFSSLNFQLPCSLLFSIPFTSTQTRYIHSLLIHSHACPHSLYFLTPDLKIASIPHVALTVTSEVFRIFLLFTYRQDLLLV